MHFKEATPPLERGWASKDIYTGPAHIINLPTYSEKLIFCTMESSNPEKFRERNLENKDQSCERIWMCLDKKQWLVINLASISMWLLWTGIRSFRCAGYFTYSDLPLFSYFVKDVSEAISWWRIIFIPLSEFGNCSTLIRLPF